MKKMLTIALGLSLCFGLSLSGCGKKAEDGAKPADKAATPSKKAAAPAAKAAGGMGPKCAALLAKGKEVCNAPDVAKYGAKSIAGCLKGYQATASGGNELKCKMMTPK